MKRAFTIVELLVVIAVIGILGAIVTNAAMGSMKKARGKRAQAMCMALEQAISAYYAQVGEWPGAIEDEANKDNSDETTHTFDPEDADKIFYEVVGAGFGKSEKLKTKSVLVDAMSLFVARRSALGNNGRGCYDNHGNQKDRTTYCGGRGCIGGEDFSLAVAKSGQHHIRLADMAYGYQGETEGKFCRFWITYNRKTDSVTVSMKGPDLNK